jgi:hypothetical protein
MVDVRIVRLPGDVSASAVRLFDGIFGASWWQPGGFDRAAAGQA